MRIISLDTAMNGCAVGILNTETGEASSSIELMMRGHAERLVPLIQETLTKARLDFPDINMIATTTGPGAFTGLRIGLSTARALGLALNIPVVGVTTLSALASSYFAKNKISQNLLVLIETKRTDFYGQLFSPEGEALSEPFALSADVVSEACVQQPVNLIGDANDRFISLLTAEKKAMVTPVTGFEIPDPVFIARIGHALHESGDVNALPEPLYLRDADVSQSKRTQRTIADESG